MIIIPVLQPFEPFHYFWITTRIFTLINAQIAEKAAWCPLKPENLSENAPEVSVNTAIHQNI